tara:strand:- start:531 stop:734 length:204 start_codon:yes stop_codon:yes gene_type:complete
MPTVGKKKFGYTEPEIEMAEAYSDLTGIPSSGIPMSNAQDRMVNTPLSSYEGMSPAVSPLLGKKLRR